MTEQEATEAIRLCQQILNSFNRITKIIDAFLLTTSTPFLPSPPLAPH
jgi:hypothetical protein